MFANEVDWKEVAAEFWHGFRHLSPQKVWDWLTDGPGSVRLWGLLVIAPMILLLSSCASTSEPYNPVRAGTENTVTVNWNTGMDVAVSAAEAHCKKYGKHAQFAGKEDYWLFYNCVKP